MAQSKAQRHKGQALSDHGFSERKNQVRNKPGKGHPVMMLENILLS